MFCILEDDEKTFCLLKKFITCFKQQKDILNLEINLQTKEIKEHLYNNGINENDTDEKIKWVNKYGKAFRDYLNTIKIASLIWITNNYKKEFTKKEFQILLKNINDNKDSCLDTIHG